MARSNLNKRLEQIESSFTDEQKIRFFILNDGVYTCMATRRKSDSLADLTTGKEDKNIVYEIVNPRENE